MENRGGGDQAEGVGVDPAPKENVLSKQIGFDLGFELQVEDLNVSSGFKEE